jgi:hypothetical protein
MTAILCEWNDFAKLLVIDFSEHFPFYSKDMIS